MYDPADGGRDVHADARRALRRALRPGERQAKVGADRTTRSERRPSAADDLPGDRAVPAGDAIVVDEGITSSLALYPALTGAVPHDYIACKGGSIGFGTPVATGAAVAAPGRRVVTYVGDGSAAYTIQSLWTQAREGLDVTNVILANDKYAVLQMELMRAGGSLEGAGSDLTELEPPVARLREHLPRGSACPRGRCATWNRS